MRKLKVLDMFSGIGGFSLGLERTGGFETVAFCEIEPFCRRVLAKHWPEVPIYEDVRTLTADTLARDGIAVEVICGGFPCQNISQAGAVWRVNSGLGGERSGLFFEIARLVRELRPGVVFMENVQRLVSRGLADVLGAFAELGYDAEWASIPGSAIGAPQDRPRVWIVAYAPGLGMQGFLQGLDFGPARQGWACGPADLPRVHAGPFRPGRWPQPLICRGDNRPPDWVDRIRACGNAVIPQIPEMIGNAILASITESERAA